MNPKDTISVQLPEELKQALTAKAKAEEMNLSQLCRRILKQHIAANPPPAVTAEHPGQHANAA